MSSLRWKLVGLYAAILTVVIGGFSVALVLRVKQTLGDAADVECEARARALAGALEVTKGSWFVDPETSVLAEFAADRGLYFVVVSDEGKLLLSSPLAVALGIVAGDIGSSRDLEARDKRYRELTVAVTKPAEPDERRPPATLRIACGKDVTADGFAVGSLVAQLVIIGPVVLLLSLAGGLFLVGRALDPIDRMARTAQRISASDMTRRLDVAGGDEIARLGTTLNDTFDRLQGAFERQTRFTADASHELRTPLSVIAGNVELGLNRKRSAEEYSQILTDMQGATRRMHAIVEGLLTLARSDAKETPPTRTRVALAPLVDEIVGMYRPLAEERGVSVERESEGDVAVMGDPGGLKDLVTNLVTNAIRYNRRGGRVAIKLWNEGGRARIAVEDTGIGIAEEHLPHIFDRFYRVDEARPQAAGGSGLGLAIAKAITEAHSGAIQVASRLGVGTSFLVWLPA